MSRPADRLTYTFIGSSPGSGSTLLSTLLTAHPALLSFAEFALFSPGGRQHELLLDETSARIHAKALADVGLDIDKAAGIVAENGALALMDKVAEENWRVTAVSDKHPSMTPWMGDLQFDWPYPLRLVYLHRHPMAVMRSIRRKLDKNPEWEPARNWGPLLSGVGENSPKMLRAAFQIAWCLRGLSHAKQMYPVLEVTYDDLLSKTGGVLLAIWNWMGLYPLPLEYLTRLQTHLAASRLDAWKTESSESELEQHAEYLREAGVTWVE